ncbi:hypothetical protein GCM10009821_24180 [Aeromicrobium halocynthiae]|uniref:Uncharacterized protein n=1 Tax=Aeromicrobium halocynthiae TaxID=560557 RepID=A0ABN2W404_9ACTN
MVTAFVLVLAAASAAGVDVVREARERPAALSAVDAGPVSSEDSRRQVNVTISVSSDAPFSFTYVTTAGEQVTRESEDGSPVSVTTVERGNGPYVQVWAQTAPWSTFVRCEVEVDDDLRSEERIEGPAAATYCVA